jgi:hypothetical protein
MRDAKRSLTGNLDELAQAGFLVLAKQHVGRLRWRRAD